MGGTVYAKRKKELGMFRKPVTTNIQLIDYQKLKIILNARGLVVGTWLREMILDFIAKNQAD